MKSKRIVTILVIALIPIAIIIGLTVNKRTLEDAKKPIDRSNVAIKVTIDTVALKMIDGSFTLPATIIADEDAAITAEAAGKIASLNIQLGTTVKKGQVIGTIDVTESRQKLEAAVLSITKLTADYERNKILLAGNATNANAVTDAKYELDAKKLEAAQLRTQISKANIVAPLSGIVTDRQKVLGEYVGTGTVIASVTALSALKANVSVPESRVMYLKKGDVASLSSDAYPGEKLSGTISYISPKGDENHNYTVQLLIANTASVPLKVGLYIDVQFTGKASAKSLVMIPKTALANGVKDPFVYIYNNGAVASRKLVTGVESGDYIEVKSGLSEGELIVTSGQINLSDGSKAQIIKVL